MTTDLRIFAAGVLLGLGAAIPIGPVNLEIARRAITFGFPSAVCLGLGAVSIDVVYALLAVTGVSVASGSPYVFYPLALAGTLFLSFLGISSLRSARKALAQGWAELPADSDAPPLGRSYLTGLAMTSLNPMTLAFWFGGISSQALSLSAQPRQLPFLAGGVFVGTVSWVLTASTFLALLGRWRKPWWLAAADLVGGLLMLLFALLAALAALRRLIQH